MKEVAFYFDFSSPFAYFASRQIEDVAARHGATVRYRPFLLGALFRSIGTPNVPLTAAPPAKRRHLTADMLRCADYHGIPFRLPTRFPMNTVKPLRMVLALPEPERPRLIAPMFAAYWAHDRDLTDDAVLADVASRAGFDGGALVAATADERLKQALKSATDAAEQAGVCGAPCFVVGRLLFWGQDRLLFVEKALDGWVPAAERAG